MGLSEEEKKENLKQLILDKRKEGKVVVMGLEGPMSMPLESIIQQPVDGLLYDLNRLEETALTFIDDPKWVNDFAVALVIRKLKSKLDQLEAELRAHKENEGDECPLCKLEAEIERLKLAEGAINRIGELSVLMSTHDWFYRHTRRVLDEHYEANKKALGGE